ncbi:hypothetical protein SOVF_217020 [Spinacia oleracea]|nr:hypothetical protein SOVF_217020 [Spinacia oleracea]
MAVEAVVSVIIQKVIDLLRQESINFDKVVDQVEDIRIELRKMRGFLTDAEERQENDAEERQENEAKKWAGKYLETVYNVEDIVESYVRIVHKKKKKKKSSLFQNYGFYFHDLTACQKLRKRMKQEKENVKKLKEERPGCVEDASLRGISFGEEQKQLVLDITSEQNLDNLSDNKLKRMLSGLYEDDSNFVGFKDDEKSLLKWLTDMDCKIIVVVGPLGSGKTTLVKRIYNHKSIKEQFACHAWLNVSEERDFKDVLLKVCNQVNKKRDNELAVVEEGKLKERLCVLLQAKGRSA